MLPTPKFFTDVAFETHESLRIFSIGSKRYLDVPDIGNLKEEPVNLQLCFSSKGV
jgi:hypothetical protein